MDEVDLSERLIMVLVMVLVRQDLRVSKYIVKTSVASCNVELITNLVQLRLSSLTYRPGGEGQSIKGCVAKKKPDLCQRVGLVDWNELCSKSKANQRHSHLLASHD